MLLVLSETTAILEPRHYTGEQREIDQDEIVLALELPQNTTWQEDLLSHGNYEGSLIPSFNAGEVLEQESVLFFKNGDKTFL